MIRVICAALASLAFFASMSMAAESYPSRPVRVIVPFPPGGNVDTFARVLYRHVERELGQAFDEPWRRDVLVAQARDEALAVPVRTHAIELLHASALLVHPAGRLLSRHTRQLDGKRRTLVFTRTLDRDSATMQLDDVTNDGQTQAQPAC